MKGMSFRASRRLSDLADRAAEVAAEGVAEDREATVESRAERLVHDDDLLREAVECSTLLGRRANARRKAVADPWSDDVLADLREARESARSAVEGRLDEVVEEATETGDADRESEGGEVTA